MKVIITMPAYNEESTIGSVIDKIKTVMSRTRYNYQILVVDDGSSDRTKEVAREKKAIVYSLPLNYGLAETFNTEIEKSLALKADIIVHVDADGQYELEKIPVLIKEVEKGNDLVLGSRFKGKIESMPLLKRLGNFAFSRVISHITKFPITDAQTGFRAFNSDVAKNIKITSTHTYTQEQIIRAVREKFRVKEIPVNFYRRKHGSSRLMKNPMDYALKAWINIFRIYRDYEPLKFFGWTGFFFLILGLAIGLWLLYLFITTGIIGHIPSAILSILFMLVGLQIILFGFLADVLRK